jgi:phage-related protein (TIGR01555 family)
VSTPTENINGDKGNGTGVRIHPSRVVEFIGNDLPDWRLSQMGGVWGDSVLQTVDDVLKDFGLTVGGIANMINDAKMDVIKIPDFSKNIANDAYANRLLTRFRYANMSKSTINSLLLDKDEEWQRITTNFGGVPQVLQTLLPIVAGAGGIPVSRLVGQAPAKGLGNSTSGGESDLRNYYDEVTSKQKTVLAPALTMLDQVIVRSALGDFDPSIYYEWTPLYQPDPKELADIAFVKAQATNLDVQMALINEDALRAARINQLIEDGTYPGLDDAIEEHGAEPPEPTPEELAAHTALMNKSQQPAPTKQPQPGADE